MTRVTYFVRVKPKVRPLSGVLLSTANVKTSLGKDRYFAFQRLMNEYWLELYGWLAALVGAVGLEGMPCY